MTFETVRELVTVCVREFCSSGMVQEVSVRQELSHLLLLCA